MLVIILLIFFTTGADAQRNLPEKRLQRKLKSESRKLVNLGHKYYGRRNWDMAVDCGHRSIQLDSANLTAYHFLSDSYSARYDHVRALNIMRIAEKRFPNDGYVLLRIAQLWLVLNADLEALAYYEKSQQAYPTNPLVYFGKSVVLYRLDRKDESLQAVDKGLTLVHLPNPYVIWFKGVLLYEKEEYQEALSIFRSLSSMQSNNPTINFYLGMCYYKEGGNRKRARRYLDKAQKRGMQLDEQVKLDLAI